MTETVHVITDLGPTDEPGLVVPAKLLGPRADGQRFTWATHIADWQAEWTANPPDMPVRHTNHPCNPTPHL